MENEKEKEEEGEKEGDKGWIQKMKIQVRKMEKK